jgi:hypothetical protein
MELYPHWLDGEFVRITSDAIGSKKCIEDMIRALKMHALLGTQFILNDVQVFDSAAVLHLFADNDMYDFVRHDRNFLDLRVEPDPNLGNSPFALAARGLTRTQATGWISSAFWGDSTPIKRLADEIIKDIQVNDYVDPERPSRTARDYSKYARELKAVRRAVHYFGTHDNPNEMIAAPGERTNYYQVLCDSFDKIGDKFKEIDESTKKLPEKYRFDRIGHVNEDLAHIRETLEFIDKEVEDPDARKARSRVLKILNHEPDITKQKWIWNNVVQAWNYATQMTLQSKGGSVGNLPGAVSPVPYSQSPTDILVPIELRKLVEPLAGIADLPMLPIEIDEIKWNMIKKVRAATADTMEKLNCARSRMTSNIDELSQPLRNHLKAVGLILQPAKKVPKITYLFKIVGISGITVIGAIGNPDHIKYIVPIGIVNAMSTIGSDIWCDTDSWRQRKAITNTLFKAAVGQSK